MTLEEAKKIAGIAAEVDNGCPVCIQAVVANLNKAFPEFIWEYKDGDEVPSVRPK